MIRLLLNIAIKSIDVHVSRAIGITGDKESIIIMKLPNDRYSQDAGGVTALSTKEDIIPDRSLLLSQSLLCVVKPSSLYIYIINLIMNIKHSTI